MTLDDLKVFVAVCDAENLSAVARELGCTQPAVSQHVTRLERDLGCALLERRARGVAVTEAGRVLYEGAIEGLDAIAIAVRQIEQLSAGESGRLGITTGGTTVKHFMREVVVGFRDRYPEVSLHFHSANSSRRCLEALRVEKADVAFVTMSEKSRGIEQRAFLEVPWSLVVRRDDPDAGRREVAFDELGAGHFITLPERSASQLRLVEALAARGVRLNSTMTVDDWDTAILLVELGLGRAITPALHGRNFAREGRVVAIPIKGIPPASFGWAARRWRSLPKVALDFVEIFRSKMAEVDDVPGLRVVEG
jgi:DNA-binding transcriptional LysR family regulator